MAMCVPSVMSSPFFNCAETTQEDQLAILQLKRDLLIPAILRSQDDKDEGYDEGKVTNTRFGSFPHTTLIGVPWGSQVRASAVDTGSRGRKGWERPGKKRKREDYERTGHNDTQDIPSTPKTLDEESKAQKAAVEAKSGFVHILPPTPELWTAALPHRTQVVYTPDYSYILHRIKARPGTRLIEAGAGSGSFTHAAARAVYNGYPQTPPQTTQDEPPPPPQPHGKIYSYEFHAPRAESLTSEISSHNLTGIVELTARDVCAEGFQPSTGPSSSIKATSIFLDLPAPWLALKHLTRSHPSSPLDPGRTVHICTFSPCLEQVQRTITALRQLGWLEIEMVEIAAKRIEIRRERVGLQEEGLRGVNDTPANVDEAVGRLRELEGRAKMYHEERESGKSAGGSAIMSKQQRLQKIKEAQEGRKLFKEGRLVTRAEPELKTHTSYLVFAVLPREWTEEDEKRAREKWPDRVVLGKGDTGPVSRRTEKRVAKAEKRENKRVEGKGEETDQGQVPDGAKNGVD